MLFQTISDARLLIAVAEAPSFAQAGRRLGMPPATVTRRIAAMEDHSRVKLFERSTRAVRPTEAGLVLLDHARRLVAEADSAEMSMETLRDTPRGWIRISAPVMLGETLLGPIIGAFLSDHPECDVFLDLSNAPVDLVAEGFDVAVRVGPVGEGDLVARKLGTAGAALYRNARSKADPLAAISELEGLPCGLLRSAETRKNSLTIADPDGQLHHVSVKPRLIGINAQAMLDIALATDLVVVLPRMVAYPAVTRGTLRCELRDCTAQLSDVSLVFPSKRLMRPIVRQLVDHLAANLPPLLKKYEYPET
ncbi:LysR family transcriptional regulator [Roseivivax jejudonensis]|nr:LysR family transcriptional regulator [Roseivivax jejudonensis]